MESTLEGLSLRQMKLKILYTFDSENKNNCLARPPGIVNVHIATLEDATEIGVIDLRTCATAIAQASPELIGSNVNDFTVYAYDYSEPETPLAGQGMLSWALASPESLSNDAPAGKMITGRVTRSILGLFSRNTSETLEVKLRLTPVPGKTQGDYLDSLQRYQEMSGAIGQDFDPQVWTNFIQAHSTAMSAGQRRSQISQGSASPSDRTGLENVQRILSGDHTANTASRPGSRSGTPTNLGPTVINDRQISIQSRPSSRASAREGNLQFLHQDPQPWRESFNSGDISGDDVFDEGPAKKRAKLTAANWQGKPDFNIERQPESLRVVASTAASVRLHRPVPFTLGTPAQDSIESGSEEPARPPTPVPVAARAPMRRAATVSSGLRRESAVRSSSPYMPPPELVMEQSSAGSGYSPERHSNRSISSTPVNMPSSPPVIAGQTSTNTSPGLPPLHKNDDTGFLSGTFDDLFDDGMAIDFNDDLSQLPQFNLSPMKDDQGVLGTGVGPSSQAPQQTNQQQNLPTDTTISAALRPPPSETETCPPELGLENNLPNQHDSQPKLPPASANTQTAAQAPAVRPAARSGYHSPRLAPAPVPRARQMQEELRSSQPRGGRLASDPVGPPLQRAQTWTGGMGDLLQSDASINMDMINRPAIERKRKPGKEQTQARLEAAVKTGQIPPICDNCGTIDTPCWRKAWSKLFGGGYDLMECSGRVGQFVGKEIIERDEKGEVKLFRAYKLSKGAEDKDYELEPVNLCNSCGLWLQKRQCMRPESRWNRNSKDPNDKGKKPSRPRSQRNAARKGKKGDTSKSDAPTEPASSPPDEGSDGAQMSEAEESGQPRDSQNLNDKEAEDKDEPTLPPVEPPVEPPIRKGPRITDRSISVDNHNITVYRAVKSSPIRPPGSNVNGPIEIDLTPKPLCRQLFSSPTKPANPGLSSDHTVLTEISPNIVRRSPRLNKTRNVAGFPTKTPSPAGKTKNHVAKTPLRQEQPADSLEYLFNASDNEENNAVLPPQTPTPIRRSNRLLSKTPSKTQTNQKQNNQTMTPSQNLLLNALRTPKGQVKFSQHPAAAALLGHVSSDVAEMTPFTRQIHEILTDNATPLSSTPAQSKKQSDRNKALAFDFPDLPSLQGSSPNHHDRTHIDFSEFTHLNSDGVDHGDPMSGVDLNELLSTDVPMPSSPPLTMGGLIDWGESDDTEMAQQQHLQRRTLSDRQKHWIGHLEGLDSGIGMADESQMGMSMGDVDFQKMIDQAFSGER